MRRLATWFWMLPWPPRIRRLIEPVVSLEALQFFLVPHFRCGVVGIIQNDRGQYLLFKHTYRNQYPWGLPTGFLEPGEQPDDALQREICEEAGLSVELHQVWKVYVDERAIINLVYRGRAVGGSFKPSAEISAAGFYHPDNLPVMRPDQRHLLEASREEPIH